MRGLGGEDRGRDGFDVKREWRELEEEFRFLVPTAWDAARPIIGLGVRAAMVYMGSREIAWAQTVTADDLNFWIGVAMIAVAVLWSAFQKFWSKIKARRAAILSSAVSAQASAVAGVPTPVIVSTNAPEVRAVTTRDLNLEQIAKNRSEGL